MAKRSRTVRTPLILFGEGPTEELFLGCIKQLYSTDLAGKNISLGNGGGGSPGSMLLALEKKFLVTGAAATPALVLMDADVGLDADARRILKKYPNIKVVFSTPECLEGFLLDLLDDLPPAGQHASEKLKLYFHDHHLTSREHVLKNFKAKRHALFPIALFEVKKTEHAILTELFIFLELIPDPEETQ
jgi:hypothetical protein